MYFYDYQYELELGTPRTFLGIPSTRNSSYLPGTLGFLDSEIQIDEPRTWAKLNKAQARGAASSGFEVCAGFVSARDRGPCSVNLSHNRPNLVSEPLVQAYQKPEELGSHPPIHATNKFQVEHETW
eukprot:3676884-Rhodomonas_salina.1